MVKRRRPTHLLHHFYATITRTFVPTHLLYMKRLWVADIWEANLGGQCEMPAAVL